MSLINAIRTKKRKRGSDKVVVVPASKIRRTLSGKSPSSSVRTELKAVDYNSTRYFDNVTTGSSTFFVLNGIQTGGSFYQRNGRQIKMRSIAFKYTIEPLSFPAPLDQLRVAIVFDRQPNGALPALSDIFQDCDSAGATKTDPESWLNLNNRERFRIIHHHYAQVPQVNSATSQQAVASTDVNQSLTVNQFRYLPKECQLVTYKSDGNGISDIATGVLYLIAESANATTASATWTLRFNYRIRFYD